MSDEPSAEMRTAWQRALALPHAIINGEHVIVIERVVVAMEEHAEAAVAELRRERDDRKASRNALLAATNEATLRLYAERDAARAETARYTWETESRSDGTWLRTTMRYDDRGDYVRYEDHEAAAAELREQLDNERHARKLYQDEHVTMTDEMAELREKLKLAEAFDQARLSQIKHAEFATFATQENYTNAIKERDAARAEAVRLRGEVAGWHERVRHPLALMGDPCECADCTAHRSALAQEPKQ